MKSATVFFIGVRRQRIAENDAVAFLSLLPDLSIRLVEPTFETTFRLASLYGLTFYDAAYLEIALREELPLASLDKQFIRAAESAGVILFQV